MAIIITVLAYFAILFGISHLTSRKANNDTFYRANRRAPWYMVAFGMVGASISGITFVSVPGMVLTSQMTYLQMCLGFIVGYLVIAFVLLPLYYRLNLTSIYTYLGQRLGMRSYKTGASFFLLSKMTGAAVRFYVICIILQQFVFTPAGIPFAVNVIVMVALIWLYTRRGGIGTLVFTDSFQTLCLFTALIMIILSVISQLNLSVREAVSAIAGSDMSRIFVFDDWLSPHHFVKQFLSGAFIAIVMTGLDQDMMQKNLTCKTLRDAQKDMCTYGVAFVPANLLFLALGVLLTMVLGSGLKGDEMLPTFIQGSADSSLLTLLFTIGIVAASFSSADSALTSLTTCFCVDIRQPLLRTLHPLVPPDQFHLTDRRHLHPGQLYLWPVAGTVRLRSIHQEAAQRHVRALYLHHLSPALLPSGPHRPASLGLSFWLRTADAQRSADVCRAMGFIPAQISGTYRKTSGT